MTADIKTGLAVVQSNAICHSSQTTVNSMPINLRDQSNCVGNDSCTEVASKELFQSRTAHVIQTVTQIKVMVIVRKSNKSDLK